MHILHTVVYKYPKAEDKENSLNNLEIVSLVIISFYSMTLMFYSAVICWS